MNEARAGNGDGKVPGWLSALGVKVGEYLVDSKLRWKRAMKARCMSPAARVYACLGLHTMAFQQELAVKLEAGKRVPLTPQDIARETGIRRDNVKRAVIEELEPWGLAKWEGSIKGRVRLYAWALPRPVVQEKIVLTREYNFEGIPPELVRFVKRFKWRPDPALVLTREYLSEIEQAAREFQSAEIVLRRVLDRSRARGPLNKEERNGKKPLKETPPAGGRASQVLDTGDPAPAAAPPARPPVGSADESVKNKLRAHLLSLTVPAKLQDADFEQFAALISDDTTFELFTQNTGGRKFRKWTLVLTVARETCERAKTYPNEQARAAAAGAADLPTWARGLYEREQQRIKQSH